MNSRYYEPKNNHLIHFAIKGVFVCEDKDTSKKSHDRYLIGKTHTWITDTKDTQLPNGDIERVTTRIRGKVDRKRKDMKCRCGGKMIFEGYWVREEKIIKPGKIIHGLFTMGGESRNKMRYFKKKSKQKEYCIKRYNEIKFGKKKANKTS